MKLLERLATSRPLLTDSATGTWFQQRLGAEAAGGNCCDEYNVTAPDLVREMYRAKIQAGADVILSNTFNSSPLRLAEFDMSADAADRFNAAGVRLLREAIAEADREIFVGGNVGPSGKVIGQSGTYEEVRDSMAAQIRALVKAGVDVVCFETIFQSLEAQSAIEAARDVLAKEGASIPIYATFAFMDRPAGPAAEFRTFFGDRVSDIMDGNRDALAEREFVGMRALGVDIVGANCSIGVEDAVAVTREFRSYLGRHGLVGKMFVSAKPNSQVMATMQYEDPDFVAQRFQRLVEAGADLVGFCCGSTPAHVAAVARRRDMGSRGTRGEGGM
jgi:5-methyltetrahydrofolate--homocysteine methyltransferase